MPYKSCSEIYICKHSQAGYPHLPEVMRKILAGLFLLFLCSQAFAQVDVETRRTLTVQSGIGVARSDESPTAFGFYWYNQNNYPWTNTALRVLFAGIFADMELSCFIPSQPTTAIGFGAGGGLFIDSIEPYERGKQISTNSFFGDLVNARVFINQTIPNPTPLPINVRGTYAVTKSFYRKTGDTKGFDIPDNFLTQTLTAELRLGGIEPGLTAKRGAELYISLDANYRDGFDGFGLSASHYPANSMNQHAYGSLSGKIPIGPTVLYPKLAGGLGNDIDQLSAWKLGGNLINLDPYTYTIHGYYTRELYAENFALGNLAWTFPICEEHGVTGNLYGDWALIKPPPPEPGEYHNYLGVGAGVGFRGPWKSNWLVSYGYGINAVREGEHGGHEVSLAFEKKF